MKFETSIERRLSGRHKLCLAIGNYENKKILDIGCSYGWFEKLNAKKSKEIIAIDINKKDLDIARKELREKNVKFSYGSALDLRKFKENYFDMVVMFDVIEHIPKNTEEIALREIRRVLRKNGTLIISTPAENLFKIFDPAWYFGHRHYSKNKMKEMLEKNGFAAKNMRIGGAFYEIFGMILFYICKWLFKSEIPFKKWFDKKRDAEYLEKKNGFATLFAVGEKV
ncbi:MAG: methyltransferase domain-containing protein [Nanoarchaeota archaeon]